MQHRESEKALGSPRLEPQLDEDVSFMGKQPNLGLLRQLKLFFELGAIRKTEEKTAEQYTSTIRELHKKLCKAGVTIPDHALALIMLRGLPMYRYEGLVLKLSRDEEKLSSILVESRLIEEEMRNKKVTEMKAFICKELETKISLDKNGRPVSKGKGIKTDVDGNKIRRVQSHKEDSRRTCLNAAEGRVLRYRKICRSCDDINLNSRHSPKFREERILEEKRKVSKDSEKENKKVKMCNCEELRNYWILDSGSAEHGTFIKEHMVNFEGVRGGICMANGSKLSVQGTGSVSLNLAEQYGGGNVVLNNVRYIPELETNLISLGSLDESGMKLIIKDGKAEVHEGGKILFTAHNEHNVFVIRTKEFNKEYSETKSKPTKQDRIPQVLATGWRRFSMSDESDKQKSRSTLQSLWKN